jgi:polyphosphate kinase 2 (PPK2 family)
MLEKTDLSLKLTRGEYHREIEKHQAELGFLSYQVYRLKRPVAILFEGWDASGKGGAIKRLTEALDPRGYIVWPIAAPAGEDREHHYLYRFWRRLPEKGQIAIFDRTWYGRVLVERVEQFTSVSAWKRSYNEINQFERNLVDFGTVVIKFWLQISKEEQLKRFNERKAIHYKQWKITDDDWRNRSKWDAYRAAVEEMLQKTNSFYAPWSIVPANDKLYARAHVLKTVVEKIAAALR